MSTGSGFKDAPLVIRVDDAEAHSSSHFAFLRSPVRIGRSSNNEIVLPHPFVSGRHGLIQFDDAGAWYTDLGSRNRSVLAGVALRVGQPVLLPPDAELQIGTLRLSISKSPCEQVDGSEELEVVVSGKVTELMRRLAHAPAPESREMWGQALAPGRLIGRFELIREIGRGGFGVVFEALDRDLRRVVAFKAARPGLSANHEEVSGRLQQEAEAAARLSHPNIVTLHDVGSWQGGPYLIMELLRGETLQHRLERGPLPLANALDVAIQIARAIAYAHDRGVTHRDLKPANVFLCQDEAVRILDFGLAHILGLGKGGGTPGYMAPEQERGAHQDSRSDVFSAAVMLCETLRGCPPGAAAASEREPATGDARPAGSLAGCPESLAPLLERAVSEDPDARPENGRAWLEALLTVQRAVEQGAAHLEETGRGASLPTLAIAVILGLLGGAVLTFLILH